jgi:hypothetical protein
MREEITKGLTASETLRAGSINLEVGVGTDFDTAFGYGDLSARPLDALTLFGRGEVLTPIGSWRPEGRIVTGLRLRWP